MPLFASQRNPPTSSAHLAPPTDADLATLAQNYRQECQRLLSQMLRHLTIEGLVLAEVLGAFSDPEPLEAERLVTLAILPHWSGALPLVIRRGDSMVGTLLGQSGRELGERHLKYSVNSSLTQQSTTLRHRMRTGPSSLRMYDAQAAVVIPITMQERLVGAVVLESRAADGFKHAKLPTLPPDFAESISQRDFDRSDFGKDIQELTRFLTQSDSAQMHARSAKFPDWMRAVEQRAPIAQDPRHHRTFYDQILQVAIRIPRATALSGAILLLRQEDGLTLEPYGVSSPISKQDEQLLVVMAQSVGPLVSPPEAQWRLKDAHRGKGGTYGSITGRAIASNAAQIVVSVQRDKDYISSGTEFDDGSELNCPLNSGDGIIRNIGTISLLTSKSNAFVDEDLTNVNEFCRRIARLIWRNSQTAKFRRASHQLGFGRTLLRQLESRLDAIQPSEGLGKFEEVRKWMREEILKEAISKTEAQYGVLAQVIKRGDQQYFSMVKYTSADPTFAGPKFLQMPTSEGIMGHFYNEGKSGIVNFIDTSKFRDIYVKGVEGSKSEMVALAPAEWHADVVINLESPEPFHFITTHLLWAEYLAELAVTADTLIQRAERLALQQVIEEVVASGVSKIRHFNLEHFEVEYPELYQVLHTDHSFVDLLHEYQNRKDTDKKKVRDGHLLQLHILRYERNLLLEKVLDQLRTVTNATVATLFLGTNTYLPGDDAIPDFAHGLLSLVVQEPKDAPDLEAFPHIPLVALKDEGIIELDRYDIQARLQSDDHAHFFHYTQQTTRAYMLTRIVEGSRFIGILLVEFAEPPFTPSGLYRHNEVLITQQYEEIIKNLSHQCASIIATNNIRLRELQLEVLREYELELARNESLDRRQCVSRALRGAHAVTAITDGWGALIVYDPPAPVGRDTIPNVQEYYQLDFDHLYTTPTKEAVDLYEQRDLRKIPAEHALVQQILVEGKPRLVLDLDQEQGAWRRDLDEHVQALLCIPYPGSYNDDESQNQQKAILVIASHAANFINHNDQQILGLFLQTLMVSLNTLELLRSSSRIIGELQQRIETLKQIKQHNEKIDARVKKARELTNEQQIKSELDEAINLIDENQRKLQILVEILGWFTILLRFALETRETASARTSLVPLQDMNAIKKPLQEFVRERDNIDLIWSRDFPDRVAVLPYDGVHILNALLFGCLEIAIRRSGSSTPRSIFVKTTESPQSLVVILSFASRTAATHLALIESVKQAAKKLNCTVVFPPDGELTAFTDARWDQIPPNEQCEIQLTIPLAPLKDA